MAIDLANRLFIFRPECSFSSPATQCSSGWVLYVLVFLATVLFFRSAVITLVVWIAFLLVAVTTNYGLPWAELTFHSVVGSLIGILVLYSCEFKVPSNFPRGFYENILGAAGLTVNIFILLLTQGGVDVTITETRNPYGIFISFVLALVWALITSTVLFCIRSMDAQPYSARHYYVRSWASFFTVFMFTYIIALLPHSNSYIKSFLLLSVSSVAMVLYEQLLCPQKQAIE